MHHHHRWDELGRAAAAVAALAPTERNRAIRGFVEAHRDVFEAIAADSLRRSCCPAVEIEPLLEEATVIVAAEAARLLANQGVGRPSHWPIALVTRVRTAFEARSADQMAGHDWH